jgi:hypothetical protein
VKVCDAEFLVLRVRRGGGREGEARIIEELYTKDKDGQRIGNIKDFT